MDLIFLLKFFLWLAIDGTSNVSKSKTKTYKDTLNFGDVGSDNGAWNGWIYLFFLLLI